MYKIVEMNREIGQEITTWRYEGEYEVYNLEEYKVLEEKGSGITKPERWKNYLCFYDEQTNELIAYINIMQKPSGDVFIGIGIKPVYCGKGKGKELLAYGITRAIERYPDNKIALEVRSWNKRAIKCYIKAGFEIVEEVSKVDHYGNMAEFTMMEYKKNIDK